MTKKERDGVRSTFWIQTVSVPYSGAKSVLTTGLGSLPFLRMRTRGSLSSRATGAAKTKPRASTAVTVFAPLSFDPDNAQFRPYFVPGLQLYNYRFEIFDRWGNLMFRTEDTEAGWRGPFRAEDMQPAVFVWYLLVDIDYCGRVRQVLRKGDVTIVR